MSNIALQARGSVKIVFSVVVLALALLLPAASVHAGSLADQPELATVVRCDPQSPAAGVVGEEDVVVDIYIEDIVGLYGVDVTVSFFDTTIAQVVDQSAAAGVQIEPLDTFFIPDAVVFNTANNTAGTIQFTASQIAPSEPVDGSGPVARITFAGVQAGSFNIAWGLIELSDIDGALIPWTAQPCTITFTNPLAVTLSAFEASAQADHVLVAWETVSEIDTTGFNLYRSETPDGPRGMLNAALIPAHNVGASQGYAYSWQDFAVQPDRVYHYWLEDISLSGVATLHGPVSVQFAGPTAVTLSSVNAMPGVGAPLSALWVVAAAGLALGSSRLRRCSWQR